VIDVSVVSPFTVLTKPHPTLAHSVEEGSALSPVKFQLKSLVDVGSSMVIIKGENSYD